MIKVTAVRANEDYTLDLTFSDGSVKRFDVKPYLKYEVFKELQDHLFQAVKPLFNGRMNKTSHPNHFFSREMVASILTTQRADDI